MTNDVFEYDVALSFAQEDRVSAERLADRLAARNLKVFLAEAQAAEAGGGDFVNRVAELLRTKARYCVLFFSRHYPLQAWTDREKSFAREHALRDADEYILALRLEDRGSPTEAADPDAEEHILDLLESRLRQNEDRSGPPPRSHDLRSGNVPKQEQGSGDE